MSIRREQIVEVDVSKKMIKNMKDVEEPRKKDTDPPGELNMSQKSSPQRRPFTCKICFHSFKRKHHLKGHLAVHSNVKSFECPQCSKRFSFGYGLKRHSKIHAKDAGYETRPFECHICTQRFKMKQHLKLHMLVHCEAEPLECPQCSKMFSRKATLHRHIKTHVEDAKKAQKVRFAETKSANKFSQAREPTEATKGLLKSPAEDVRELQAAGITDDEFIIVEVDVSKKMIKNMKDVEEPRKKDTDPPGELNMSQKSSPQRRPFTCKICFHSFKRKHHLKGHLAVHSNVKSFECPQCSKRFSLGYSLKRHSKIHAKEAGYETRPFECHICTKRFKMKQHLKLHMHVHCEAEPLECPQCSKMFSRKATLHRHIKTHVEDAKKAQKVRFAETKSANKFSQAREPTEATKGLLKSPAEM
ncbi:zinc finger protein 59-like [Penaeus chinensis]|uniref:zinc finger protein 59-like n=1 Tax=Penaeus chinensis TaxID=139456 RepID=UPI001FB776FB|nr:zinc finger protein 59-like [Penaeus chinensis]